MFTIRSYVIPIATLACVFFGGYLGHGFPGHGGHPHGPPGHRRCPEGTYDHDRRPHTACVPFTVCQPGTYVAQPGTPHRDRLCRSCASGTFSAGTDASACTAFASCVPGEYVAVDGSSTGDRVCAACAAGSFSTIPNALACDEVTPCEPGTSIAVAATSTSDQSCAPCAEGTFSAVANAGSCSAFGDCLPGELVVSEGTATSDRSCGACPDGQTSAMPNATACEPAAWLLSYFGPEQDLAADSLHLAYSLDGLRWSALAYGRPVHSLSGMGTNHVRDPFLLRRNDGTFVYLATDWTLAENGPDYWNRPSSKIVVAESTDLITFTNARLLDLSDLPGPGGSEMHAWAPEAYWDEARGAYAIVWSGNDASGENRIYVSYTEDFTTVLNPTPDVLFDPGYSVIDATIERADGRSYLLFKDETDNGGSAITGSGKDIQIARAESTALDPGSFVRASADYVTRGTAQAQRLATEGPFVIPQPELGRFVLFADFYLNGGVFGAWSTPSLDAPPSTWTRMADSEFRFPSGVRHAHAMRVTVAELEALIGHFGVGVRLRTTYQEASTPFYVAHSWYHGIITPLADRTRGQLADDFVWKAVPGLADPSDPSLVSFEAVGHPGRYLRIDSADPNRYPSCSEGSNRGWALCWLAPADRHHLSWIDVDDGTARFESDATFRRVAALNGDPTAVSLQWHADPARYLRHVAYQLFATPIGDAVQRNDATFLIERD